MERLPDELSARVLCMVGIERERRVASMACRAFTSFASRGLLDCRLVRIRVRTGNLVDRIRLEFDDGAVQDFAGGIGGIEREPFDIAPGDALVGIQCRAGDNLDAIQFRTRRGHLSRFYGNIHGGRSVPNLYRPHGIRGLYVKARAYGDDYNCYYSQTILTRILNAFERPTSSLKIFSPRSFSGYHVTGLAGPLRRNWERFPPLAAEFTEREPEGSRRTHRMGTRGNPRRSVDDDSDDESAVQSDWSSESDY
mmetsp:Transcript_14290/g.46705  ORF Transcript_14290/g.46705 Transcript_14290/m.46705 type:complete len:252 (+) Transcript_14290:148-903(+)